MTRHKQQATVVKYLLLLPLLALAQPALAARTQLGVFGSWAALRDTRPTLTCFVIAEVPNTLTGKRRGPNYVTVAIAPRRGIDAQVHWAAGFPIDSTYPVSLTAGTRHFALLPRGDSAWAADPATDAQIVNSLRRLRSMTLKARSRRGSSVTEQLSLEGFSAAFDTAQSACSLSSKPSTQP